MTGATKPTAPAAWIDPLGRWIQPRRPKGDGTLALALQGGGSFGAFTWGVLDRLLEEPGLPLAAVSGTSAGAVNGAMLVGHWTNGGPEAARLALEQLWRRLSERASLGRPAWLPGIGQVAGAMAMDLTARLFSPYQLNPLDHNPLREILAGEIDFAAIADPKAPALTVAATRISDGTARLFRRGEVTLDAILASACLPLIHQAVEIDGEGYWDGGYSSNPPLKALIEPAPPDDLLLVQLNPLHDATLPKSAQEIGRRVNQLVFNRPLLEEWAAVEAQAAAGRFRLHRLVIDPAGLPPGGPLDLDWAFLSALRDQGRAQAEQWLASRALTET